MTLISDTIPNLVNGVSQQSDSIRLASQCEEQVNLVSDIAENLFTRPPTKHKYKILGFDNNLTREKVLKSSTHLINRDITERYRVVIVDDTIKVISLDGAEHTVSTPDGTSYLVADDQKVDIRAISVKDNTFIVNRTKTVLMDETIHHPDKKEALLSIKQAAYDTTITVTLDGHEVKFKTGSHGYHAATNYLDGPDGNGSSSSPVALDTSFFAQCIAEDFKNNHPNASDYNITYHRAVVFIERVDGGDFDLTSEDTRSDTQAIALKGKTSKLSNLPLTAPDGFYIEIEEDDTNDWDNYYVKFVANTEGEFDKGIWREVQKYGIKSELDKSTMPHVLVRESDGNFTFKQGEWGGRSAGDETTAPDPPFVGHTINDLFLVRNRLGLLSNTDFITSRARKPFEFFNSTATTVVDSDPIYKTPTTESVAVLNHALPLSENLLLFSDQEQFIVKYENSFSNKTVDPKPITNFVSNSHARPVKAGKVVMFPTDNGDFTAIQEYFFTGDDDDTAVPAEITAAIPSYIPKNVFKLSASTTANLCVFLSSESPDTIYPYKYYWNGNEKIQSAWSKYKFYEDSDSQIVSMDFINTVLHLTVCHEDGLYAEEMDFSAAASDPGHTYVNRLDRRVTEDQVSMVYDGNLDQTEITLPFSLTVTDIGDYRMVLRESYDNLIVGYTPKILSIVNDKITVVGDCRNYQFYFGQLYDQFYTFSHQFIKEQSDGGGFTVIRSGRLQMRYWDLLFEKTGSFTVEVTPKNTGTFYNHYTGNIIGDSSSIIGEVKLNDGHYRFPVFAKNDEVDITVRSKSHLPITLINAEWEAFYSSLSRRI